MADMKLSNGDYVTAAGSTVSISGLHGGRSRVEFDWCEEPNACPDCRVRAYEDDGQLVWDCDHCGGGRADLMPAPHNAPAQTTAKAAHDAGEN